MIKPEQLDELTQLEVVKVAHAAACTAGTPPAAAQLAATTASWIAVTETAAAAPPLQPEAAGERWAMKAHLAAGDCTAAQTYREAAAVAIGYAGHVANNDDIASAIAAALRPGESIGARLLAVLLTEGCPLNLALDAAIAVGES